MPQTAETRVCAACGTSFPVRGREAYCGDLCRRAARAEQARARYWADPEKFRGRARARHRKRAASAHMQAALLALPEIEKLIKERGISVE